MDINNTPPNFGGQPIIITYRQTLENNRIIIIRRQTLADSQIIIMCRQILDGSQITIISREDQDRECLRSVLRSLAVLHLGML